MHRAHQLKCGDRVAPKLVIKALSCCCVILQRLNLGMRLTSTSDMAGQADGVLDRFSGDDHELAEIDVC